MGISRYADVRGMSGTTWEGKSFIFRRLSKITYL